MVGGSSAAVAADPPNQPFDLIYSVKDVKYRIYQDGVGMLNKTEGTLIAPAFNGPGIVKAYLVWAGLGRDADGVPYAPRCGAGRSHYARLNLES